MFLSYRVRRYGNLDTLNSKIRPLQQILEIDGKKSEEEEQEEQEDPIIIEEDIFVALWAEEKSIENIIIDWNSPPFFREKTPNICHFLYDGFPYF